MDAHAAEPSTSTSPADDGPDPVDPRGHGHGPDAVTDEAAGDRGALLGPAAGEPLYLRVGRYGWASLGIAGMLVLAAIVVGSLSLVMVPVILAIFPAALLMPASCWLKRRGLRPAAAALLTIVVLLGLLGGIFTVLGMFVATEAPSLRDSLGEGVAELEQTIEADPLGLGYDFPGFGVLAQEAGETLREDADGEGGEESALPSTPAQAAGTVTEGLAGLVLALIVLFFYLKDEGRLADGLITTLPRRWQHHATELAQRFWRTTGAYFRGQLLVALVDAVFIGIGLALLGVPLVVPLAVLVFFGALFPIIGALVSGGVAVVVALADSGPVTALLVLGVVLLVQQIEGHVLQPVIMSNAVALHPLVIILSLTAGSVLLGILGAFLAVPVAAGIARALDYARAEMGLANDPLPAAEPVPVTIQPATGPAAT